MLLWVKIEADILQTAIKWNESSSIKDTFFRKIPAVNIAPKHVHLQGKAGLGQNIKTFQSKY